MLLMGKHRIYIQDINYPTVIRGKEKLRIAPTPFHTPEMQEEFVSAIVDVWNELGLDFMDTATVNKDHGCKQSFSRQPVEELQLA